MQRARLAVAAILFGLIGIVAGTFGASAIERHVDPQVPTQLTPRVVDGVRLTVAIHHEVFTHAIVKCDAPDGWVQAYYRNGLFATAPPSPMPGGASADGRLR